MWCAVGVLLCGAAAAALQHGAAPNASAERVPAALAADDGDGDGACVHDEVQAATPHWSVWRASNATATRRRQVAEFGALRIELVLDALAGGDRDVGGALKTCYSTGDVVESRGSRYTVRCYCLLLFGLHLCGVSPPPLALTPFLRLPAPHILFLTTKKNTQPPSPPHPPLKYIDSVVATMC